MDAIPSEILCEIFKYLSFSDRRQMALVNTKWYYASIHPKFVRNEVFSYNEKREKFDKTFGDSGLPLFSEFKTMLLNSNRKCFNLIFHGSLYVNQVFPIFLNLADYIVSVHISGLDQLSDMLLDVILNCNKLEQLEFNCVSDLVITNRPRKSILSLKRMSFRETNLTDFYFNNIMQCAPNLEDLGLKNCNILNWHQALRRFYPTYKNTNIKQNFNSCDIFSYVSIVNYLETTKNIHKLRLNDNFHIILNLPIHIKLVSLELSFVKALTILRGQPYEKIGDKLSNISTLENLDLKYIPCCLLVSCLPKLCNLKRLNAQYFHCRNQNECISEVVDSLKNKKNLRELIMYSFLVQDNLIPLGIADCTLEKLSTYKGSINNVFKISRLGQNLTKLKIVNGDILTASDYKLLFKTLIRLKKLVIEKCNELDDNVLSDFSINNLKALSTLRLSGTKLTYHCFKYIKNKELREVYIRDVSLGSCIKLNNMSDFKNVLEAFSGFVPELTQLEIYLKKNNGNQDSEVIKQIPMLNTTIYNNFKKMKICYIY